jgi:hypothetical protein
MKIKSSVCKKAIKAPAESVVNLANTEASLKLYGSGGVRLEGDVKAAAMLFANYMLNDKPRADFTTVNGSLKAKCKLGEDYTIEWANYRYDAPYWWQEFKAEYEKICRLKAFL